MAYYSKNVNSGSTSLNLYAVSSSAFPTSGGDQACTTSSGGTDTGYRLGSSIIYTKTASWHTMWSGSMSLSGNASTSTSIYVDPNTPLRITFSWAGGSVTKEVTIGESQTVVIAVYTVYGSYIYKLSGSLTYRSKTGGYTLYLINGASSSLTLTLVEEYY